MLPADAFDILRSALEAVGIRYDVGGSWASTAFGEPRFTNDVDILADITQRNIAAFLSFLPDSFYADAEEALSAIRLDRPFNVIYMPTVLKFDLFPSSAFPIGKQELDRAILLQNSGLSKEPAWFVTPEDILLAKLYWFKLGGELSEVQWRDIMALVRGCSATLDRGYLQRAASACQDDRGSGLRAWVHWRTGHLRPANKKEHARKELPIPWRLLGPRLENFYRFRRRSTRLRRDLAGGTSSLDPPPADARRT